jgi:hypothetical protein
MGRGVILKKRFIRRMSAAAGQLCNGKFASLGEDVPKMFSAETLWRFGKADVGMERW